MFVLLKIQYTSQGGGQSSTVTEAKCTTSLCDKFTWAIMIMKDKSQRIQLWSTTTVPSTLQLQTWNNYTCLYPSKKIIHCRNMKSTTASLKITDWLCCCEHVWTKITFQPRVSSAVPYEHYLNAFSLFGKARHLHKSLAWKLKLENEKEEKNSIWTCKVIVAIRQGRKLWSEFREFPEHGRLIYCKKKKKNIQVFTAYK